MITCATSCATRTVVVHDGDGVVRIGKGVHGPAFVYGADGKQVFVKDFEYPEGWFAGAYHPK